MNKILKIILSAIAIVILFYTTLLLLPKSKITYMEDDTLRAYALSHNLLPTPTTYKSLLKVIDNPNNPMTPAKIALGKKLYFDPILSLDKTIACASCHLLQEGGDDNRPTAIGYHDRKNPKHLNSPTVLNAALAKSQFWDGSAPDVEAQAAGPMQAPFEMNITPKEALLRLKQKRDYQEAFREVFEDGITFLNIQNAIGAYERTLLTRGSYDQFLEGDNHAISAAAKRGLNLFIQKGCKGCHTGMSVGGQSIQQFPLRRAFLDLFKTEPFPFPNEGRFLGKNNKKRFRVPILRNITKTAPYFHNGMVKELKEAIRIMSKYQVGDEFTPAQIEDMVAFFQTLEGKLIDYNITAQTP
jgi:cytochrome c peroxidase